MSESLDILQADGVIDAVLGQLKSGKEAEVWLVQQGEQVLAAKIYKERHARNFKNNAGYREGREVRNSRTARAMAKGSRFGQAAAEDAWRSAEADSLFKLHAEGVRVPTPVVFYEGILLMELVLDPEGHPAPRLVEAPPATPEDARAAYLDLRGNVVRMLCADLIHGDLSAYNVLMSWCGPTIIDFPQTLAAARNNRAEFYFRRDLDSIRNFLAGIDPGLHSLAGDTGEIWNAYVRRELTPDFAPSGRFREAPRRNNETSQQRPPREAPVAAPAASAASVDPVEAELRELEALVLRQGGGARAKPGPVERPGQGGKNRSRPKNGRGPSGGPSGRPPQGRNGRPQQGSDRAARPLNGNGPSGRPQQGSDRAARPLNGNAPSGRPQQGSDRAARPLNGNAPSGRPQQGNDRGARPLNGNAPSGRPQQGNDRGARPLNGNAPSGRPQQGNDRGARPLNGNGPSGRPQQADDRAARPGNGGGPGRGPSGRQQQGNERSRPNAAAPGGTRQENRRGPGPTRNRATAQRGGPVVSYVNRPPRSSDSGSNGSNS